MALAIDVNSASAALGGNATATWNHVGGAGALGVVVVRVSVLTTSASTFTATYGGVSMTQAFKHTNTGGAFPIHNAAFYLLTPASGTQSVVVTPSSGAVWGECGATTFTGNNTSTPLGAETSQNANAGSDTIAFSSISGNIILDLIQLDTSGITLTANQNQDYNTGTSAFSAAGQHASSTGGTVNMTWTLGSSKQLIHTAFEVLAASSVNANFFRLF